MCPISANATNEEVHEVSLVHSNAITGRLALSQFVANLNFLSLSLTDVASAEVHAKEAYFNGSAYLRLQTPMTTWDHSAISFRSCRGGEILAQQYNKNSIVISVLNDFLQVSLAGPAVIGLNNRLDVRLPYQLLDNRWHTLQFKYEYGNLYLHVDREAIIFGK